jgi:hypothetical protein
MMFMFIFLLNLNEVKAEIRTHQYDTAFGSGWSSTDKHQAHNNTIYVERRAG